MEGRLPAGIAGDIESIADDVEIDVRTYKRLLSGKGIAEIYDALDKRNEGAMAEVRKVAARMPELSEEIISYAKEELDSKYRLNFPDEMDYGTCRKEDPKSGRVPKKLQVEIDKKVIGKATDSLRSYSQRAAEKGNAEDMVPMIKALVKASYREALPLANPYPGLDGHTEAYITLTMKNLVKSFFPGVVDMVFEAEKPAEPEPPKPEPAKLEEAVFEEPVEAPAEKKEVEKVAEQKPSWGEGFLKGLLGSWYPHRGGEIIMFEWLKDGEKVGRVAMFTAITVGLLGIGYGLRGGGSENKPAEVAYLGENVYRVLSAECTDKISAEGNRYEGTAVALRLLSGKGKEVEGTINFDEPRWKDLKKKVKERTRKAEEPTNSDMAAYLKKCGVEFDWAKYRQGKGFDSIKFLEPSKLD